MPLSLPVSPPRGVLVPDPLEPHLVVEERFLPLSVSLCATGFHEQPGRGQSRCKRRGPAFWPGFLSWALVSPILVVYRGPFAPLPGSRGGCRDHPCSGPAPAASRNADSGVGGGSGTCGGPPATSLSAHFGHSGNGSLPRPGRPTRPISQDPEVLCSWIICVTMMLLYMSRCDTGRFGGGTQGREDFASDIAFEATDDLGFAHPLPGAAIHVLPGSKVMTEPDQNDAIKSCVGLTVATPVQPVPIGLTGGGRPRTHSAQRGEGSLGVNALRVTAGSLSITPEQPLEGTPAVAALTDPDGIVTVTDWKWSTSSVSVSAFPEDGIVDGASTGTYGGSAGEFLWATVRYRDGASI